MVHWYLLYVSSMLLCGSVYSVIDIMAVYLSMHNIYCLQLHIPTLYHAPYYTQSISRILFFSPNLTGGKQMYGIMLPINKAYSQFFKKCLYSQRYTFLFKYKYIYIYYYNINNTIMTYFLTKINMYNFIQKYYN